MDIPHTRHAESGDVSIAYQVVGDGPLDLVYIPNWGHPIELMWHQPRFERFLRRLAGFSRLICFDKRGSGASDRGRDPSASTLEGWMDDITTILDAAGSERAAMLGFDTGGPLATLFAASNPDRTTALVLYGTFASGEQVWGTEPDRIEAWHRDMLVWWGTGSRLENVGPSVAHDRGLRSWWGQFERAGNSPEPAAAMFRLIYKFDVRQVLPTVHVPTLVLHRTSDRFVNVSAGRYLAEAIPGAEYTELAGDDHLPWLGDSDALVDEISRFITGVSPAVESDRVLATVLFTDVVGSTRLEADLGDRRWREVLDSHDQFAREQVQRFRGRLIKSTGDGVLAIFDGPARAARCARALGNCLHGIGLEMRAGLHAGEVEIRGEDVSGIAVNIGQRVSSLADAGEVLVSRTVTDLVAGSGLEFEDRGEHELKGVPGLWQIYAVT